MSERQNDSDKFVGQNRGNSRPKFGLFASTLGYCVAENRSLEQDSIFAGSTVIFFSHSDLQHTAIDGHHNLFSRREKPH